MKETRFLRLEATRRLETTRRQFACATKELHFFSLSRRLETGFLTKILALLTADETADEHR